MSIRDDCDCGHDRKTQHTLLGRPCACLALKCECKGYRPPGTRPPRKLSIEELFVDIDEDPPPSTDRMGDW
jgi:hypothetical protein